MRPGFKWMISSFSSHGQHHPSSLLLQLSYYVWYEPLYPGKSLTYIQAVSGMDGQSNQHLWQLNFLHLNKKITLLIDTLLQNPCRKNIEKIIGILLWVTSLDHHVRFWVTSLYRDLYAIPAINYSIPPTKWEYFLSSMTVPHSYCQKYPPPSSWRTHCRIQAFFHQCYITITKRHSNWATCLGETSRSKLW